MAPVDLGARAAHLYATALRTLRGLFALPLPKVSALRDYFAAEACAGLSGEKSSLAMLPTYVTKRVSGDERGHFFALDLGGTNFRVLRVTLEGGGVVGELKQGKYHVPEQIKTGTGEQLFGFLADAVAHFVATSAAHLIFDSSAWAYICCSSASLLPPLLPPQRAQESR